MLLIAVLLVAAALQPLDPGEPAETVGVQTMPSGSIEPASDDTLLSPPDSVRLPGGAEPRPGKVEGAPAQHGPAWPDTVYLRSGQTLVGRVLRTPGGKITMEVPSLTHGAPSYRVRFDRRQVLRIGRRRSVLDVPAGDPVRPQWSVHFGAYSEGQRVLSYPQICAEIGYARVQSDFAELERAIQHLYDTNATLRGHGLEAGVFKRETHGLALGVLTRFSPRLAAGLTGVLTKSSSVTGAAMGEVRVRPGAGFCPWLSAGMMWQRIRVKDHQYVEVQSQPDRWFFKGLTWKAPTSAFALGLRFDTAPDIGAGLTFAFYWVSSPHIHSTIHGDWSQWNPLAGEFPASIRIDTLVFTAGLQIN